MKNPWSDIEKPVRDVSVRLVEESHPLRLYWGVDTQGRYLFVYDSPIEGLPEKRRLPSLSGIDVYLLVQGGTGKLLLALSDKMDWEMFLVLCMDLVRATFELREQSAAAGVMLRRLQRWQELLKRERPKMLSLEQIKGLMGELLFLKDRLAVRFGWDSAVSFWKGPESAPQDFAVNETAVEVKCQSGGSRPAVRISSIDQLAPQLPVGFLVVYTLAGCDHDGDGVLTLNSVIAEIQLALTCESESARERFGELIYLAGYISSDLYDEHCFSLVDVKSYALVEGFPRISGEGLSLGVESVSYTIRLDACARFAAQPEWWEGGS